MSETGSVSACPHTDLEREQGCWPCARDRINELRGKLKEAESLLSGRTISCSNCNELSKKLQRAVEALESLKFVVHSHSRHGEVYCIGCIRDKALAYFRSDHIGDSNEMVGKSDLRGEEKP